MKGAIKIIKETLDSITPNSIKRNRESIKRCQKHARKIVLKTVESVMTELVE